MLIHPISDIHLDIANLKHTVPDAADVVIVAGDVHPGVLGVMWAAQLTELTNKPVIFVAGNHEFYGKRRLHKHYGKMQEKANELGVHFLQNSSVEIDGVKFIGGTMWTNFGLNGDVVAGKLSAPGLMNDYEYIYSDHGYPITPDLIQNEHTKTINFFADELDGYDGTSVIVSHHAPHGISCNGRFKDDPGNHLYASNLSVFMKIFQPNLWIHGHVHSKSDYEIENTRIVANPRGYDVAHARAFSYNFKWDPNLLIEV